MEVECKGELMGLLADLILPSFRGILHSQTSSTVHQQETLLETCKALFQENMHFEVPEEKTTCVQFILALALSIPCRLSTEGAPHVELGRQRVQQQILSYQEVLTLDTVSLNEKYSQPIKDIQVHKA